MVAFWDASTNDCIKQAAWQKMGYLQLDSKQKAAWRLPNLDADARAHPPRGLRVRSPPVALPLLLSSCSTVLVDCLKICPPPRPIGSGKKALMHGPLDPGKSCSCSWPARGQGAGTLCSNVSYCTYDSVLRKNLIRTGLIELA
jgi:hypothetical protein